MLALGFAGSAWRAYAGAFRAGRAFDALRDEFLQHWDQWGARSTLPRPDNTLGDAGLQSAAVLKIHEDRAYPGAVVASLSVPWGNSTDNLVAIIWCGRAMRH